MRSKDFLNNRSATLSPIWTESRLEGAEETKGAIDLPLKELGLVAGVGGLGGLLCAWEMRVSNPGVAA